MSTCWTKDPDATLDYEFDWTNWLDGDTITASEWITETGIIKDSDAFTATGATVWLSGGTLGQDYSITNRVTTAGGRTDDRTARIEVRQK